MDKKTFHKSYPEISKFIRRLMQLSSLNSDNVRFIYDEYSFVIYSDYIGPPKVDSLDC